ncbi:thiopurine s-methyltransferase [Plakobranchus ocellatus]|uniref:Thiopurine s-methyltransferase n=1 Tax=Plakobranchus ocellatus TaxID=259542 RepID=A0AAV4C5U0_9GAST|nr:thiopurine s-methyltransferase [Plakobranchus ocellatus]
MPSTPLPKLEDGLHYWDYRYEVGHTVWQLDHVHPMLEKHFSSLNPKGKGGKILVPMCGMSVDMKWLLNKGATQVVGVDSALKALDTVMANSGQEWTESNASELGPEAKLFTRKDEQWKLYCGDMMKFTSEIESAFDMIWERGGVMVLPRKDVERYCNQIKDILKVGGRMLLETIEYNSSVSKGQRKL